MTQFHRTKWFAKTLLTLLFFTTHLHAQSGTSNPVSDQATSSRPNIVFVLTDDQGLGDLSCMGNQVVRTCLLYTSPSPRDS